MQTKNEVIREGLRALIARDHAVASWLKDQVAPAYDAIKADPTSAVSVDQVRSRISAKHKVASSKL